LRTSRPSRSLPVNVDIKVSFHDRLAAIRRKCAVGDLGRRRLFENVLMAASVEALVLAEGLALHDTRATTLVVVAEFDIATTPWEPVVLRKAEVVLDITAAMATAGCTLESVAVPSLTTAERLVKVVQGSGRGTIHGG
jgi:hypothetical protein